MKTQVATIALFLFINTGVQAQTACQPGSTSCGPPNYAASPGGYVVPGQYPPGISVDAVGSSLPCYGPPTSVGVPASLPYYAADPACDFGAAPVARHPRWFGAAYGLIMTRSDDADIFVGYDDAMPTTQLLTTNDAAMSYAGGVEAHVGRILSDRWAVEGVYWGLYPSAQVAQLFATDVTGMVDSPFDFTYLEYDDGTAMVPAGNYFDNAQVLRVLREYEYHNVEVNFLRCPVSWTTPACRSARIGMLAGVRYLQLKEGLDIDADAANNAFGDDLANELFYDIQTENHLVGFQFGGQLDYCLTKRMAFQAGSKAGIYGNRMKHHQSLWGGNGITMISATSPLGYAGSAFSSDTSDTEVAFVGEMLAGLSYCLTPCWSITGGYRAIFVSGVATPTGQIPQRFDDLQSVGRIESDDSLVLHGAYAGIEYVW